MKGTYIAVGIVIAILIATYDYSVSYITGHLEIEWYNTMFTNSVATRLLIPLPLYIWLGSRLFRHRSSRKTVKQSGRIRLATYS